MTLFTGATKVPVRWVNLAAMRLCSVRTAASEDGM